MLTTPVIPVWFILCPRVLMLDYAGPAEALRMAADEAGIFELHTCAPHPRVTTSLGVDLTGLQALPDELPPRSLVIIVGTSNAGPQEAMSDARQADGPVTQSTHAERRSNARIAPQDKVDAVEPLGAQARMVVDWLRRVPGSDTTVASICAGALLLAHAGRLAGRRCTTHHSMIDMLARIEPQAKVQESCLFVDDGDVLTSAGITAGIDLALHLIERYGSPALAASVARRQVVYRRRAGADAQLSPWLAHRNHLHPAVHRAQDLIAQDPARTWTMTEVAAGAHVSERHLSRLFAEHAGVSVTLYLQGLRIARARELLGDPSLSIETVAERAGFSSPRDFRRVWRRYETAAPGAMRDSLT